MVDPRGGPSFRWGDGNVATRDDRGGKEKPSLAVGEEGFSDPANSP